MDIDQANHEPQILASPQSQPNGKRKRIEPSRDAVVYPRKRAIAACRQCRVRKIKCNNTRPACGSCMASKSQCCYEDQDHSTFDPASILILDRLDQVLSRLNQLPGSQLPVSTTPILDATTSPAHQPSQPLASPDVGDASYDHLHIPSSRTAPDSILQWPIFERRYPKNYMVDEVFTCDMSDDDFDAEEMTKKSRCNPISSGNGIYEDEVLDLVQRFFDLVHIKNPVLDPDTVWSYARRVAEEGLGWDSPSCLVLILCALGCVAEPFTSDASVVKGRTSLEASCTELQKGERYYNLARRRFGLLGRNIIACQCQFLAGVYLMYTQRPLSAWSEFHSASRTYHIYLQCQARRPTRPADPARVSKNRQLEQRLYWSCYKSECELRTEIELPNSSLADFHYPDMHPSPPDLLSEAPHGDNPLQLGERRPGGRRSLASYRLHEQSWFYYLTEITLRRLSNRVLNTLYNEDHLSWTDENLPYMVKAVSEFEQQLQQWYEGLPVPIQYDENTIPAEELPYMVYGRALDIKSWVYRPLLYYLIHSPPNAPCRALVLPYLDKIFSNCKMILLAQSVPHRHHGTWYATRGCAAAALSILGAVRCGTIHVPAGWERDVHAAMANLRYWEDECPGVHRSLEALEGIMATVLPA
ncbi:hypothetical protein EDB81DRAFT_785776 [Dactylonectria macrodidyma]|uniref:Zn(2)-C6 fungal-type domain-containing protein n=1 Tax=Dactylonectria macrodidyma TaxID=307937 RepID=A0A9P9JF94_9HYPO|nr:hypothetical protein EDB81DRAFT_785776 [Dactylonectria macrodidyma]